LNPGKFQTIALLLKLWDHIHIGATRPRAPTLRVQMSSTANIVIAVVALLHVYFLVLEMFLWDKPLGLKTFRQTQEAASASKVLAANQGLYNGFLAAGLIWGLSRGSAGFDIKVFFLCCVVIAGVYGAATVGKKILYVQALPAALGLLLLVLS
jgi:putative membrane protein